MSLLTFRTLIYSSLSVVIRRHPLVAFMQPFSTDSLISLVFTCPLRVPELIRVVMFFDSLTCH